MFGIDSIINLGSTIIDKIWPDAEESEVRKAQFMTLVANGEFQQEIKLLDAKAKVLAADLQGNWLQRSWRPLLMITFMLIIFNNYIIYPYLSTSGAVMMDIPPDMWVVIKIFGGGYIVGRSGEKIAGSLKDKAREL